MVSKLPDLRIFEDASGKFNLSLREIRGEMLAGLSQFTLYGDCRKGRRPSFTDAEEPAEAKRLYEQLILKMREQGVTVETGEFQARMEVHLINDGPVTILLDSRQVTFFPQAGKRGFMRRHFSLSYSSFFVVLFLLSSNSFPKMAQLSKGGKRRRGCKTSESPLLRDHGTLEIRTYSPEISRGTSRMQK